MTISSNATRREPHGHGAHSASHPHWELRRNALIWSGETPVAANLSPFADEMVKWLQQKGPLSVVTQATRNHPLGYTNPYTYPAATISAGLGAIINAIVAFCKSTEPMDPLEAEIQRIRLHSELAINIARFCEVTIKQLLHCTNVPLAMYRRATLGQLLAQDCPACRKAGMNTHDISLLGALAHRYFECLALEHCVIDHMKIVGDRRKMDAAHSEAPILNPRDAAASRSDLFEVLEESGYGLGHMADHIGTYERKMLQEVGLIIASWPTPPSLNTLSRVPVRIQEDDPRLPPRSHSGESSAV
ncbi:hypothetical protein [Dyella sp. ASV21]|uniref:hypothetical protein n=1 Tax=Dyella sp. ASV21 TaxID=2795114 RepID=UPI0018EA537F|nr:hypothetical protein [Dyella sp. ASV21]